MKKILYIILMLYVTKPHAADIVAWKEDCESISIDRYSLQKIFTKRVVRWPNGQTIQVFIKPINSVEHRDFVLNVLGLSPFNYQQMLDTQVYAGKSSSVVEIPNDGQMIMKIEQTPGAIGYINYEIFIGSKKVTVIDSSTIK